MLTQLNNAQVAGHKEVTLPFSKIKLEIAKVLKEAGLLLDFDRKKTRAKKSEVEVLNLKLKYNGSTGVISGIKLISKPSRRVYVGKDKMKQVKSGFGISVVSTSRGLMTGDHARKLGIGGEAIFEIW